MRHLLKKKHFNMSRSHYKMLFKNLCNSLIRYERIKTTLSKAKELRKIIEPIINKSKINNLNNIRYVLSKLNNNKKNTYKLFNIIAPKYINRNGGYTRIIKFNFRKGDNALIAIIELV